MGNAHTAGTISARHFVIQPHRFDSEELEWGCRPCCRVCGAERGDQLHDRRKS